MDKMHNGLVWSLLVSCMLLVLWTGCKQDEGGDTPPEIVLITGQGGLQGDTVLSGGEKIEATVYARGVEGHITNFIVKVNGERFLDTSMNVAEITWSGMMMRGLSDHEQWQFIARDKYGNSAATSVEVALRNVEFGDIVHYPVVTLGAQNHATQGGFCDLLTGEIFTLEQAEAHPERIDWCYYYDVVTEDEHTLASPGANIGVGNIAGPEQWEIRRTTRFKPALISAAEFDAAQNDSLLLVTYGVTEGKRKAKNLMSGDIFSFKTEDGRLGLFKVKQVDGTTEGKVSVEVKIQEAYVAQ